MMNIGIIGAGSFGLALANTLKDKNIMIYSRSKGPGLARSLEQTVSFSDIIIIAIPSNELENFCKEIKEYSTESKFFVICSKGISTYHNKPALPSDVLRGYNIPHDNILALYGANFSSDMSHILHSNIYSSDLCSALAVLNALSTDKFILSASQYIIPAQISSCLKNIYAMISGIISKLSNDYNTISLKSFIISQFIREMLFIQKKLGAPEDFNQIADLIATCSDKSRNYRYGEKIAENLTKDFIYNLCQADETCEGVNSVENISFILSKYNVASQISQELKMFLNNSIDAFQLADNIIRM